MKNTINLSTIALLAGLLGSSSASALSINLGGNGPLVDLSNDNNADATVSIETGNLLGGSANDNDGAVIDLNLGSVTGGDANSGSGGAVIDLGTGDGGLLDLGGSGALLDLGSGGLLDLGGEGDLIDLANLGGTGDLLDLGDGPLLDLSGNDDVDGLIEIDLGDGDLIDLASTGSILDLGGTDGLLDLGTDGDLLDFGSGQLLDLGGDTELLALNLLNTDIGAKLNLDGGGEPILDVDIGTGSSGVAGTGVLPGTTGEVTVGGGNLATVSLGGDTSSGGGDGDGGGDGSGDGDGSGGGNDPTPGGNGGSTGSNGGGTDASAALLAGAAAGKCLALSEAQLEQLMKRHAYNRTTFNGWVSTRSLKIVEVKLCDRDVAEVESAVSGDANVARLQAFLANQAKVRAGLESKGHAPSDVIAADHSGEVLIVYVI